MLPRNLANNHRTSQTASRLFSGLYEKVRQSLKEMSDARVNYYDVLGIPSNASDDDVTRAYKQKALQWHPDKVGRDKKAEAEERFKEISEAYQVLRDPNQRASYNRSLGGGNGSFTPQVPRTADQVFQAEFSNILSSVIREIDKQGQHNLTKTAGWAAAGAVAAAVLAEIVFPPALIFAAVAGAVGGGIRGYTDTDLVNMYCNFDPAVKKKILVEVEKAILMLRA